MYTKLSSDHPIDLCIKWWIVMLDGLVC
jgi:hypothetical protein